MNYTNFDLEQIRNLITCKQNLPKAIENLQKYISKHELTTFQLKWEQLNGDYLLMKVFLRRGLKDPQFNVVYHNLLRELYALNSDIQLEQMIHENGSYQLAHQTAKSVVLGDTSIKMQMEKFVQDVAMLSLEPKKGQTLQTNQLYEEHQKYINQVFNAFLVSPQWTESVAIFVEELFLSPTVDSNDIQLLLSGLMLSAIQLFDYRKILVLIAIYQKSTDEEIRQRALVGLVLCLPDNDANIYPEVSKSITALCQNEQTLQELLELQIQFFYCMNADADNEKLQKDIIPQLMKGQNIQFTRTGIIEKEEDPLEEMLNPGAADRAMEAMEENFQKMMNMQRAGSDIYFGGFSQMKRFGFFMELSNWFVPFYPQHPGLNQMNHELRDGQFMNILLEHGPFCDSDKYSFALAASSILNQIPSQMRELLNSQELLGPTVNTEDHHKPAYVRRMYLQNLYRFYRLYKDKNHFYNPFSTELSHHTVFFVLNNLFQNTALSHRRLEIGQFLYRHHFYDDLHRLLDACENIDSVEYWRLSAMLAHQEKDYMRAGLAYDKLLDVDSDNEQALRGKANSLFYSGNFSEAIKYYTRILEKDANSARVQLNLAVAYINDNQIEKGMKYLFKLSYEYPDNLSVKRSLAWGYLRKNENEQALQLYNQLMAHKNHIPSDYLNAGYCLWFDSKIEEAVEKFAHYEIMRKEKGIAQGNDESLHDVFILDAPLLNQYHVGKEEAAVLEDLVNDQCRSYAERKGEQLS